MTISVEGARTETPDKDATHMLPIMDLMPQGNFLQFTCPTKYKSQRRCQKPDNFQDYINALPEWEQQLFLYWKRITNHEDLKTQIVLGKMLYYVTDGGADNSIGYFGWVIATDTRIITKDMTRLREMSIKWNHLELKPMGE
eukprot:3424734-Ditylum_brightwellii.AAC.1